MLPQVIERYEKIEAERRKKRAQEIDDNFKQKVTQRASDESRVDGVNNVMSCVNNVVCE